jgi:hypothetical protein
VSALCASASGVFGGHVLIAILERPDEYASEIISSVPGLREVTAVIDALPGQEDS